MVVFRILCISTGRLQVTELGRGLGGRYRTSREGKLLRTFVTASDAATAKARRSDAPRKKGL